MAHRPRKHGKVLTHGAERSTDDSNSCRHPRGKSSPPMVPSRSGRAIAVTYGQQDAETSADRLRPGEFKVHTPTSEFPSKLSPQILRCNGGANAQLRIHCSTDQKPMTPLSFSPGQDGGSIQPVPGQAEKPHLGPSAEILPAPQSGGSGQPGMSKLSYSTNCHTAQLWPNEALGVSNQPRPA